MGCDIHIILEKQTGSKWERIPHDFRFEGLENRNYSSFAFLAGVRNYSEIKPISEPRGIPSDVALSTLRKYLDEGPDVHSASWLSLDELLAFNYSVTTEDRRCTRNGNGGSTCALGEGRNVSWAEYLGQYFLDSLNEVKALGADRIVFWFDN